LDPWAGLVFRPMTVEKFSMGGRGVILCDR
jgi:hypothetical protein